MEPHEEIAEKHERLRRLLKEHGLSGLLLGTRPNFAWITAGGCNAINEASEAGVAPVLVTPDRLTVIANNIESRRIVEEELTPERVGSAFEVAEFNWWEPEGRQGAIQKVIGGRSLGVDAGGDGVSLAAEIAGARASLTEGEIERYQRDAPRVPEALETTARAIEPGTTEQEAAARLRGGLIAEGFRMAVCLVGADERIDQHRHPRPTDKPIRERAMLVAVAERHGLFVAATRLLSFGKVSEELAARQRAISEVHATAVAATRPGRPMKDALAEIFAEYERQGYPEAWRLHHQGGPTGYNPRDRIVNPQTAEPIAPSQAFAWNPTITGAKCEDTFVAAEDGPRMLTGPGDGWPVIEAERGGQTFRCAGILER
jgi:Xaa-Pro aminopeptidase